MKILMTADTVGGVWTYALDLARALEPHGVEIALATLGAAMSPQQKRDAAARRNVVVVHESTYKLEWMESPWEDVKRSGQWLLDLERQFKPDLVHLNGYAHARLPFAAPVVVVAHSCVLSWWQAVKGEAAPPSWDRYRAEVAAGLEAADAVAAPTRAMLDTLEANYRVHLRHKRVIHNGRDGSLYRPARKESFVLAAGRLWDEAKNVAALQAVAPRLLWPVCVAGAAKGPDGNGRAMGGGVLALGKLEPRALSRWFARADVYALPARYEPFGLSAVEAALSGCALVLGDIPSLREVWGDAAVFVPPDDLEALERQLASLIADPHRRKALAGRAIERAHHYTLHRMAEGYVALYRQALRRRRAIDAEARTGDAVVPPAAHARPITNLGG
jgi:glycosyltransferase involved in cell wall biosynthesis